MIMIWKIKVRWGWAGEYRACRHNFNINIPLKQQAACVWFTTVSGQKSQIFATETMQYFFIINHFSS